MCYHFDVRLILLKDFNYLVKLKMEDILLKSLINFYKKDGNITTLMNILKYKKSISLRLIDWFATNYSKKNNIIYVIYKDDAGNKTIKETTIVSSQFNVYNSYKSQLKAFSKKKFDPFCRRNRLDITIDEHTLNTTIGQLNFFRWIIQNKVIDYINQHLDLIETDMNFCLKEIKKNYNKIDNVRKPRQELSKSAMKGLNKTPMKVSITFD